ncbi:MAG: M6 family metalloprotease domain-containing protein [Acidobacteriota bacterium]
MKKKEGKMSVKHNGINHLFSISFVLLFFFTSASVVFPLDPPTKEQLEKYRSEGTLKEKIKRAKKFGNHHVSVDLIKRLKYKLKNIAGLFPQNEDKKISGILSPPPAWKGMPSKGVVKIPVILISFQDKPNANSKQLINNKIFGTGNQAEFPYESLRSFYTRSSYGQLKITGNILGWYKTSYIRDEVLTKKPVSEAVARDNLIKEVINYYDAKGHDFSQYDNDNDGDIDYIVIIWSGEHGEWSTFWWAYQTSVVDSTFIVDGKNLSLYSWQWESYGYPTSSFRPTTLIHETGHALGLPDLYDYEEGTGPEGGVGGLDMMDASNGDHNCFHKFLLDWIDPAVITTGSSHDLMLKPSATNTDSLIVMPDLDDGVVFSEFFMIQNRYKKGNDIKYPGSGILIWHIDSTLDDSGYDFKFDNSYTDHKYLRLMEADGLEEIESMFNADAGDYYNKGDEFGTVTLPDSFKYDGSSSGIFVKDIFENGENYSFSTGIFNPLKIELMAERRIEKSWLLKKEYALISFNIEILNEINVHRYIVMRKNDIDIYREIKEILSTDSENNNYSYTDKFLDEERTYNYKIVAYDNLGNVLGVSREITI